MQIECYCGKPLERGEKPCCGPFVCKFCGRGCYGAQENINQKCCAFCWDKLSEEPK